MTQFPHVLDENTASDSLSLGGLLGRLNGITRGKYSAQSPAWRKPPKYISHNTRDYLFPNVLLRILARNETVWVEAEQRAPL